MVNSLNVVLKFHKHLFNCDISLGQVLSKQVKLEVSNREKRKEIKIYSQDLKLIRWHKVVLLSDTLRLVWLFTR